MYLKEHRTIVHMDLDTFFVSVERLRDRRLCGKPLIIGGQGGRGVVSSCSYEARRYGVSSAMPMRMARRLCPSALVISGDMESYGKYSRLVTEVISDNSPLFEKSSIDEFYIDMTGMDRYLGAFKWAGELRSTVIRETGLPISFGLSANKMVSKVATGESKPNGQLKIDYGEEANFLAPLPVSRIPMIGKVTGRLLANMGVKQVCTLREIPREFLERVLGKQGYSLWKWSRGRDDSPVVPYREQKTFSSERTFSKDTIDIKKLRASIALLCEELAYKLRKSGRLTACITVKIRYSDFQTLTRQLRVDYTSSDHQISESALALFEKLYDRRLLVRLVGVRLSCLIYGAPQLRLFESSERFINLYQAMDNVRNRYGNNAVTRAHTLNSLVRKR